MELLITEIGRSGCNTNFKSLLFCKSDEEIGREITTHKAGNSVSIVITFESAREVMNAFEVLNENATIISPVQSTTYSSCFVSLIDKYDKVGVND